MDYFLMQPDEKLKNCLKIKDFSAEDYMAPNALVKYVDIDSGSKDIDYIVCKEMFNYSHIVSDWLKDILETYEETLWSAPIFLTDISRKKQSTYRRILPKTVHSIQGIINSNIASQQWPLEALNKYTVGLLKYEKLEGICLREDVAESILRRLPLGITFIKITT